MSDAAAPGKKEERFASDARRATLAFVAVLALAAVVRLLQLNAQSLTSDEVKDLSMARGGVVQLQSSEDRFPPLYHVLLGAWLKLVPWDSTGRGFSALCGVLTVAAMAGLGSQLGGRRTGLWAAGLTAVAPLAVWYSVESRAYALYMLLATVSLWQFAAAMRDDRPRQWAGFAAASIAGAYTHYYFGLLIALAGLTWLAGRRRGAPLRHGLATFVVIAIATAPSLWLLKHDLDQPWGYARTSRASLPGLGYTYFSYLSGYTLGPSLRELHTLSPRDAAVAAAPWIAILGAAAGVLVGMTLRHAESSESRLRAASLVVFCLAPAAVIAAVSHFAGFGYNVRHAAWAFAPLAALMALGAAHGRPRWLAWCAVAVVATAFAVAHANRHTTAAHSNEDVRGVARTLVAESPILPTFVVSGYMSKPLAAYLPADWPSYSLPDVAIEGDATQLAIAEIRNRCKTGQNFWLAYTREFHGDPHGELLAALRAEFDLKPTADFAGVRLYRGLVP